MQILLTGASGGADLAKAFRSHGNGGSAADPFVSRHSQRRQIEGCCSLRATGHGNQHGGISQVGGPREATAGCLRCQRCGRGQPR